MPLSFRTLPLLLLLAVAQGGGQAPPKPTSTPAGGPPLPWAVVSVHAAKPDMQNYASNDQPNGITMQGIDVRALISQAYNFSVMPMRDDEITGLPAWARSTRYDVQARVDPDDVPAFKKLTEVSLTDTLAAYAARQYTGEMLMMQALLADRFAFKLHLETHDRSIYTLTQAKGGSKLKPAADPNHGEMNFSQGHLTGKGVPASFLASLLTQALDRTVVDKTGLTGVYDFDLKFQPQEKAADPNNSDPDIFTALQEQLGLKLESGHASLPFMVVDHIQEPTPN